MKKLLGFGAVGLLVGCLLVYLLVSLGGTTVSSTEVTRVRLQATAVPAPPFKEIRDTVENMTEAQWKKYLPRLKGTEVVNWEGWVTEVDVSGSTYILLVDMDPPEDVWSTFDIRFDIPEDVALELEKNQPVMFSGTVERISEFLGSLTVHLQDVTLEIEQLD